MPSTTSSSSARRERSSASVRLEPTTMILASSESNCAADDRRRPRCRCRCARPGRAGATKRGDRARGGQEAAARVLAVDAELDGVATRLRVVGVRAPRPSAMRNCSRTRSMPVTSSVTGCSTCSRVLTSRKEIEAVLADQELAGAGADVAGLLADRLARVVEALALLVGEERRGRLLDQLLVAPLQRAVAGADDDDVAGGVGEHLRLDVARLVEVALDEALAAAEGGDRLADRAVVQLGDLVALAGHLQAAAAAAERRLDRDRQAVLVGEREHLVGAARPGRRCREPAGRRPPARCGGPAVLSPSLRIAVGRRADPGQPGVDHGLGEVGVLGEEAVAGVDGVGPGLAWRSRSACRCAGTSRPGVVPPRA